MSYNKVNYPLYPQVSTGLRSLLAKLIFVWLVKLDQSSLLRLAMFNYLVSAFGLL